MTSDNLIKLADDAMKAATPGKPVQFSPQYCDEDKGTKCAEWDTSHDLSVIREDGSRYRIGSFRHADDALFDQLARELVPEMAARIRELEAGRGRLREALEAIIDEYEDQTHGPVIYSIKAARTALQTDTDKP